MARLKQAVIEKVYKALDNDYFTIGDFETSFPNKRDEPLCQIKFRHNARFSFLITEGPKNKLNPLGEVVPMTVESPGDFKTSETHDHNSFEECLDRIRFWCENVRKDLRAQIPLIDEFDDLRAEFDKHIKEHLSDPEQSFTPDELERINKRFDELYEQLAALAAKHQVTEQELQQVKRQFDLMKHSAREYPKGMWANLTKNRIITALRKLAGSKEARKLMYEGARKLLGWDGGG